MNKSVKAAIVACGCVTGLAASAQVAFAAVSESGTKNCTRNQTGVSHGYSTGTTEHYPPGAGYGIFYNGTKWKNTQRSATVGGGGFWFVETNGSLSDSGTYATCIAGTP